MMGFGTHGGAIATACATLLPISTLLLTLPTLKALTLLLWLTLLLI